MNIFELHGQLIEDYRRYVESFICIRDDRIRSTVEEEIESGLLWPKPLVQLNPSFEPGGSIDDLVAQGLLHPECARIFRLKKDQDPQGIGEPLRLHYHQTEAIKAAATGDNYVLTTGTGSGKSLAYIIPIVDYVLRHVAPAAGPSGAGSMSAAFGASAGAGAAPKKGIVAIVVYPMNALANSQYGELQKFLCAGYPDGKGPVTFARYTGQETDEERNRIIADPPHILLTNYVMLELILTRPREHKLVEAAQNLRFLVLDELHTYRGRQGADVAFLVRRVRNRLGGNTMQVIGTSATLASPGGWEEQRRGVARVASQIFGAEVKPERVIGETLRRVTPATDLTDPAFLARLRARLEDPEFRMPRDFASFVQDPVAIFVESTLGLEVESESGRLVRATPKTIDGQGGAAAELSRLTGVPEEICAERIADVLLQAVECEKDPVSGFPPFAFRLHQFIGKGDTVYASLEAPETRTITVHGQQYVPRSRDKVLLPLAFCRECGREYYVVSITTDDGGQRRVVARDFSQPVPKETLGKELSGPGYLYVSSSAPWPDSLEEVLERLPDDWVDEVDGQRTISNNKAKRLPRLLKVRPDGTIVEAHAEDGALACHFIPAPFGFCLACGVSYGTRRQAEFAKLGQLGSGGRSTATTVLGVSAILGLRGDESIPQHARKLLSFTDNRQDASLQAGHFNDFVEIGLLRSALYRAVASAGERGLRHDELTQAVFAALDLPLAEYAADPEVKFHALTETQTAFRNVLGYRLYRDLERGWRITLPNLEQCGLLEIEYESLPELAAAEDMWAGTHPALVNATPELRAEVSRQLLDWMRRGLAIHVDYLKPEFHEKLRQQSSQRLRPPWALDENENLMEARVVLPRSRQPKDYGGYLYLSGRTAFARYLRRVLGGTARSGTESALRVADCQQIIRDLLEVLRKAGLVQRVLEPQNETEVPGYQLVAAGMVWKAGDGTRARLDPMRVPSAPEGGGRVNEFFVDFYRNWAPSCLGLEAREHTAQVSYEDRQDREARFREGRLPILFCSPTMELGVDIAELNVVNMRNVPPTPANYAQRSGRAGRSGQPALVYAYCSNGSPHDRYFFMRPEQMVAGKVALPRLDLGNEDLVRAHVHAVWLAETGLDLGKSLADVLDLSGDEPSLTLQSQVQEAISSKKARERARARAKEILAGDAAELERAGWWSEHWLDEVLDQVALRFDEACNRWRDLYRSAHEQARAQSKIILDATRTKPEKDQAERLRREAEQQLALLTQVDSLLQSDFYSYRYFASEGFLPGYSFPRLPLSAYIPGRRTKGSAGQDEFVQRPRFLAISEFGPRAILYHEGSKYVINKVILPVTDKQELLTRAAKICEQCGYLHPLGPDANPDLCESCGAPLGNPRTQLFRLHNVSTKRRERINADEEERMRWGYDLLTGVRFSVDGHGTGCWSGEIRTAADVVVGRLAYGHTATLWRINLGWAHRKNKWQEGFVLDIERGYWQRNEDSAEDENDQDPMSTRVARVIPYVEDRRNCLLLDLEQVPEPPVLFSLQAALKRAIQAVYQLEDEELAVEALPHDASPRRILFYEAAEGGAGVLRNLLEEPRALAGVAAEALRICHFDPETGEDLRRGPRAREDCEAACYDCLLSYYNQRHHPLLDRQAAKELLMILKGSWVDAAPFGKTRAVHLQELMRLCDSDLEREWLRLLEEENLRLPSRAQVLIESCATRPDFLYDEQLAAIYVDGPPHEFPQRQVRDREQTEAMMSMGYTVIRFGYRDDWRKIISRYPSVFGKGKAG
ncbi:MAG: DEAD/DEAH box helicase [Thermoleophilia bacterium]|nr:DEAD/DEAH box helicase [Thermoleophilia bacterium]